MLHTEHWTAAWQTLGSSPPSGLYDELLARYSEPHRYYHTPQHLEECLTLLTTTAHFAVHSGEVELALWFHDAVYDTRAHNNEEQSARLAERALKSAGVHQESIDRIVGHILATRHAFLPANGDTRLLVDIDLAILGSFEDRFAQYEHQIRREYSWVPAEAYQQARGQILTAFLARPAIYSTPWFHDHYEPRARKNLSVSLQRLLTAKI